MLKKIKISFFLYLMLILIITPILAKKVNIIYSEKPIKIDGKIDDWSGAKLYKGYSNNVKYFFRMNKKSMFILFKINKKKYVSTLFKNGIKLWFKIKDQENYKYRINFIKKKISPERLVQLLEKKYGKLPQEKRKQIYAKKYYELNQGTIIKKENNEFAANDLKMKESASFKITINKKKQVVAEFKIPHILHKQLLNVEKLQKEVQVMFEWGGMTEALQKRKRAMKASSGMSGGMMGGRMSGSMMGGRSSGQNKIIREPKKYSIKINLILPINKLN